MNLVGMMAARNEEWCIGFTARVALQWCDRLVVLDHASNDMTSEILFQIFKEVGDRLHVMTEASGEWDEMIHRNRMLETARTLGATHAAIIDADEMLTANLLPHIRQISCVVKPGVMLELPGYNVRGSLDRYHANGVWGHRWFSTVFAMSPELCYRNGLDGYKHHHREPYRAGTSLDQVSQWTTVRPYQQGEGGVVHLWGLDEQRLKAKHALYKLRDRVNCPSQGVKGIDTMYSWAIKGAGPGDNPESWRYEQVPGYWLAYALSGVAMPKATSDGEPWQVAECRRILAERPELRDGLDLFGVV